MELVYEGGYGLSNSYQVTPGGGFTGIPQTDEEIHAFAGDIRFDYLVDDERQTRLSLEGIIASGDSDRLTSTTDTFGGNRPVDVGPYGLEISRDSSADEHRLFAANDPVPFELIEITAAAADAPGFLDRYLLHPLENIIGHFRAANRKSLALPIRCVLNEVFLRKDADLGRGKPA